MKTLPRCPGCGRLPEIELEDGDCWCSWCGRPFSPAKARGHASAPARKTATGSPGRQRVSSKRASGGTAVSVPTGRSDYSRLFEVATPDLYRRNAFRVLGLSVNATGAEVRRRQSQLMMSQKLGLSLFKGGSGYLSLDVRPSEDDIRRAVQRLHDPETRLLDELFWFWPREDGSGEDGLKLLAEGRVTDTVSFWLEHEREGGSDGSCKHNLAVLCHALALDFEHKGAAEPLTRREREACDSYWENAYKGWGTLFDDGDFWRRLANRMRDLDDPRLTPELAQRIRNCLPKAILLVNARMAVRAAERSKEKAASRHLHIMRGSLFDQSLVGETLRECLSDLRQRIKMSAEAAEKEAEEDPKNANRVAWDFLNTSKSLLATVGLLLPEGDPLREAVHDEVSNRALRCQITYATKTEDWCESQKILDAALPLAQSASMRNQLEDNIEIVKNNSKYGTCFFCERKPPHDKACIHVAMYGDVQRVPSWDGTQIKWRYTKVRVPRCMECKRNHAKIAVLKLLFTALGIFIGVSIAVATSDADMGPLWGVLGIIGYATGGLIARSTVPYKIKSRRKKRAFYTIQELRAQGWNFGEKPSTSQ